jgi:hypothetical protein
MFIYGQCSEARQQVSITLCRKNLRDNNDNP